MKKKVAILFSGQIRTNFLNPDLKTDNRILESLNKYLFNNQFREYFDYDVFISVDNIDINKASNYFGNSLRNVNLTEKNWFMEKLEQEFIPKSYDFFHNKYMNRNFKNSDPHAYALFQYYRMYCSFIMAKNYEKMNHVKYDYFVRIRPDAELKLDMMLIFNILEHSTKKLFMEHEQLCIFKSEFQNILRLVETYGEYDDCISKNPHIYKHLTPTGWHPSDQIMNFAPEKQFVNCAYRFSLDKRYEFDDILIGCVYPSFNILYRGNDKYGHVDESYMNNSSTWIPRTKV